MGKQKTLALGVYPEVSLKEARLRRDKARLQITEHIDPAELRRENKNKFKMADENLFSVLSLEWFEKQKDKWSDAHAHKLWNRLKDNTFKKLDARPLDNIQPKDILAIIRTIESRGALDVASRVLQDIRRVFRYGVQIGRITDNPARELTGVLKTRNSQHRASLPTRELGQFLRDLDHYETQGKLITKFSLQLLVLTFLRPSEVRLASWDEFDLNKRLWRIPAHKMKMKTEHLVPLSNQAITLLKNIQKITGKTGLLFPSHIAKKPISDNTMRLAMFKMGYDGNTLGKSRATPHGFRANASSILNEQGFNPDAIERQLSHIERNGVRAAYIHHARFLDDRIEIMQWWADYLDEAKAKV